MLRITHSETGALAETELQAALPPSNALAQLAAPLWDRAWTERTTILVARMLANLCSRLPRPDFLTLADGHGLPGETAELQGLVRDLLDWQAGRVEWSDVASGFLLTVPPGNGKTMIAAALAGSARAALVVTSYAGCQRAEYLADYLLAMSERVEEAIAWVPSVFFVDELDCFVTRTGGTERGDRHMTSGVNALFEQLTRLSATPGILVVAATNHPDRIDPVLIRAGRSDTHLRIDHPDRAGIGAILRDHLGGRLGAVDPEPVVDRLVGVSSAAVAVVARTALGHARRAGGGSTRPISTSPPTGSLLRMLRTSCARSRSTKPVMSS